MNKKLDDSNFEEGDNQSHLSDVDNQSRLSDEVQSFEEVKQKKTKRKLNPKQLDTVKKNMTVGNKTKQLKKKLATDDEVYENLTLQSLEKILNSQPKEDVDNQSRRSDVKETIKPIDPAEKPKKQRKAPVKKPAESLDLMNFLQQINSKIDSFTTRLDSMEIPKSKTPVKTQSGDPDYYKILADKIIGKK